MPRSFFCLCLAAAALVTLGCGKKPAAKPAGAAPTAGPQGSAPSAQPESPPAMRVAKINADRLPPLGDAYPNGLEGGRVQLSNPPKPWLRMRRNPKYLASWSLAEGGSLPRMTLVSEPAGEQDPESLSASDIPSLVTFAQTLFNEIGAVGSQDAVPTPVIIGDSAYVHYLKPGELETGDRVEQMRLVTVGNGKRYLLTLQTLSASDLEQHRDAAYAVAAGMKFPPDGASSAVSPTTPPAAGAAPAADSSTPANP